MVIRSLAPGFSSTDAGEIEKGPVWADPVACRPASFASTKFCLQIQQTCRVKQAPTLSIGKLCVH